MHIIYVDDEKPALDNFRLTVESFSDIESLNLFQDGEEALKWVREQKVDVAFLDMETSGIHGLELAKRLKDIDSGIRIIFVTAHSQFALEAFGVDAIGYVLKPYSSGEIRKELDKAKMVKTLSQAKVIIETIPSFVVYVNGQVLHFGRTKIKELFALLVDRGDKGITSGEAISYLWPDRPNDVNTQSLYRVTLKRLIDTMETWGIDDIIDSRGREKYIRTDKVECDLYRIFDGDTEAAKRYAGEYMREYSWAEERNAQLANMLGYIKS